MFWLPLYLRAALCALYKAVVPSYMVLIVVKYQGTALRLQVKLERTHCQEKKTNWLKTKRDQLVDRKKSHLSIGNKLLMKKPVIKPTWSYGIELWGCASKSNIFIMHKSQYRVLRAISNARRYVTNHTLQVPYCCHKFMAVINCYKSKFSNTDI